MTDLVRSNSRAVQFHVSNGFYEFPSSTSVAEIRDALPSAGVSEIISALAPLFSSMARRNQSEVEMKAAIAGYAISLEDAPLFAVKDAVRNYLKLQVPDQSKEFVPSPPSLLEEVNRCIFLKVRREIPKAKPVEQTTKPTEAERAARVEAARKLIPKPKRLPAKTPNATEEQLAAARLAIRLSELKDEDAA